MRDKFFDRVKLQNREEGQIRKKNVYIDPDSEGIIHKFRTNIESIQRRFDLVTYLLDKGFNEEAEDMLRFQLVYVMSSLDFFMHEIYSHCLLKIYRNELPKTNKYYEIKIPLRLLENVLLEPENMENHLKKTFTDIHSGYTFMSPSRLREILNIMFPEDEFALTEKKLKEKKVIPNDIRLDDLMEAIYDRRNKIAHQTDMVHGGIEKASINMEDVKRDVIIISEFVESLYEIICMKE